MSAGPVIQAVLGSAARIEILDQGPIASPGRVGDFDEQTLSRSPGLSVPADTDWIEFRGEAEADRVQKWWSARMAGGGAWLWYGQLSRFQPSDFNMPCRLKDVDGHDARAWPVGYDELRPHYEAVESSLLPYGNAYGMDPAAYASLECSTYIERPAPSHFERSVIDRLSSAGFSPYVGQTVLGGRAWDVHPISPLRNCQGGVESVAAHPFTMRRTWIGLLGQQIADTANVHIAGDTVVARIIVRHGKALGVEALERTGDGQVRTVHIKSPIVVLACGTLETVRILLMSDLPNRAGLLGAAFTLTQERVAYALGDIARSEAVEDLRDGTFANVVLKEFYEPRESGAPVKCGKFALYDGYAAELPYRHVRNLGLRGEELANFLSRERTTYAVKVSFKGESIPWPEKRVELGTSRNKLGIPVARICYQPHPYDRVVQQYARTVIDRIAHAFNAERLVLRPEPTGTNLISAHHHGGAIFGTNERDAVTDTHGECFEARGLFVADSSVMPTSGATNSTLTAMALAHRLGGFLAAQLPQHQGHTSMDEPQVIKRNG
jgi:glucose dehydrogenase